MTSPLRGTDSSAPILPETATPPLSKANKSLLQDLGTATTAHPSIVINEAAVPLQTGKARPSIANLEGPKRTRSLSVSSDKGMISPRLKPKPSAIGSSSRVRSPSMAPLPSHSPIREETLVESKQSSFAVDFIRQLIKKAENLELRFADVEGKEGHIESHLENHLNSADKLKLFAQEIRKNPEILKKIVDGKEPDYKIEDPKIGNWLLDKLMKNETWKEIDADMQTRQNAKIETTLPNTSNFETHQTVLKLMSDVNRGIEELEGKFAGEANAKARVTSLKTLKIALFADPKSVIKIVDTNKQSPLYKSLGPLTFVSSLMQVKANFRNNPDPQKEQLLDDSEKVALYGYTTNDYAAINTTMRDHQGNYTTAASIATFVKARTEIDKKLNPHIHVNAQYVKTYLDTLTQALGKLPDIPAEENGKPVVIKRGFRLPDFPSEQQKLKWLEDKYKEKSPQTPPYQDFGLTSCTRKAAVGEVVITYINPTNAKTLPFKDVSQFSASPGEGEVIAPPGTRFECHHVGPKKLELTII